MNQANIIQNIFKTYAYYNTISLNINHMISPQLEDPELRVCGYDMTMGVQKAFWTSGTYFRRHLFTWHSLMYDWSAKGKLKWIMWAVFGAIGSSLSTQPQPERSFKNSVEILKTQQLESTSATAKSLSSAFHQFHLCSPHLVTAEFVLAARGSILQGFSLRRWECRKTHARPKLDVWFCVYGSKSLVIASDSICDLCMWLFLKVCQLYSIP